MENKQVMREKVYMHVNVYQYVSIVQPVHLLQPLHSPLIQRLLSIGTSEHTTASHHTQKATEAQLHQAPLFILETLLLSIVRAAA